MASKPKSRMSRFGNALLDGLVLAADLGPMSRMNEIEVEIDRLQEEYAVLNKKLDTPRQRTTPYVK